MKSHNLSKPWRFEFKNDNEAELFLYSEVGDSAFGDSITAQQFAEDLRKLGPVNRIRLRINSGGGNVFSGISIYNQLVAHPATIVGQVDGLAASISSIILMSASKIVMNQGSFLMIHNPFTVVAGDAADFLKMSQTLAKVKDSMIPIYQRHSHLSATELSELMNSETWFTPEEAIDAGLADDIADNGQTEMPIAASLDLSRFRGVPAAIAAQARQQTVQTRYDTMTLEQLQTEHQQLLLQRRLNQLKYDR